MSCIDVLIFGVEGELIGVFDVFLVWVDQIEVFNQLIVGMVVQMVCQIEVDIFCVVFLDVWIIVVDNEYGEVGLLLVVDGDDIICGVICGVCKVFDLNMMGLINLMFVLDLFGCDDGVMGFEKVEKVVVNCVLF